MLDETLNIRTIQHLSSIYDLPSPGSNLCSSITALYAGDQSPGAVDYESRSGPSSS